MKAKSVFSTALICSVLIGSFCSWACAGPYDTIENSSPQEITNGMGTKLGRGVANFATGWMEFPKQIYVTSKEDGAVSGIFIGPFKGIGMTVIRTFSGIAEFATFFIASPRFYSPYFEPAYVWQKE